MAHEVLGDRPEGDRRARRYLMRPASSASPFSGPTTSLETVGWSSRILPHAHIFAAKGTPLSVACRIARRCPFIYPPAVCPVGYSPGVTPLAHGFSNPCCLCLQVPCDYLCHAFSPAASGGSVTRLQIRPMPLSRPLAITQLLSPENVFTPRSAFSWCEKAHHVKRDPNKKVPKATP